jgi:hypothetical protein
MTDQTDQEVPQTSFREHPLIRDVVADAAAPPRLALLVGYAGDSTRRGYDRLYLDEELRRWAEIPSIAIRRCAELPASPANPWGATVLWVGFADPADLQRYPVLVRGEQQADLTDVRDLRALRAATPVPTEQDTKDDNGRPGGGPSDRQVPKPVLPKK